MVDLDRELVVVRNPGQDLDEIWWQAHKVGFDHLVGQVADGLCRWRSEAWPTTSVPLVGAGEIGDRAVLDVRQRHEFAAGHVPGSAHAELGALLAAPSGPDAWWAERPTVVVSGDGERAMGAASLLLRAGHRRLAVLDGGPGDCAAATSGRLETGVDAVQAEREPA